MNELVSRLRRAYQRELDLYGQVERLGRDGVRAAKEGRPLADLNQINAEKQEILRQIADIEIAISSDKHAWRRAGQLDLTGDELDGLLQQLRSRIESILELEKESERWIVERSGVLESRVAAS